MKRKHKRRMQSAVNNSNEMLGAVKALKALPTRTLLVIIELVIKILAERGEDIRDFDHRNMVVKQVRIYFGRCFFLCDEKPLKEEGKRDEV